MVRERSGHDAYRRLRPRKFSEVHHLDIPALVARLSAKPFIRIDSGMFVGGPANEIFVLGPTQMGIALAVRRMSAIRREALMHVV